MALQRYRYSRQSKEARRAARIPHQDDGVERAAGDALNRPIPAHWPSAGRTLGGIASRASTAPPIVLLTAVDAAHGRLSGPAAQRILQSEWEVFGKPEFEGLAGISASHLYGVLRATSRCGLTQCLPDDAFPCPPSEDQCASPRKLVADGLVVRPAPASVAGTSSDSDLSKRSAAVRAAAERLLTTPRMSRFSTGTVFDSV